VTAAVAVQIAAAEGDDGEWAARLMAASDATFSCVCHR
jgi:hypothetical protein